MSAPVPLAQGNTPDIGAIQFIGDYANNTTPYWLSMFGPTPGPGNVQVSSMTVAPTGFINIEASTISTMAGRTPEYAMLMFERSAIDTTTYDTEVMMNKSHLVPGITVDEPFLSVTKEGGISYDQVALNGIQIFGDQSTDATVNTGCIGILDGTAFVAAQGDLEAVPAAVRLITPAGGSFNTSTINAQTLSVSQIGTFSTINGITASVSTLNSVNANISTLNVSSVTATSITAATYISSSTTVSHIMDTDIANISTANISSMIALDANINNISTNTVYVNGEQAQVRYSHIQAGAPPSQFGVIAAEGVTYGPSPGQVFMNTTINPFSYIRETAMTSNTDAVPGEGAVLRLANYSLTDGPFHNLYGSVTMPNTLLVGQTATISTMNATSANVSQTATISTMNANSANVSTLSASISATAGDFYGLTNQLPGQQVSFSLVPQYQGIPGVGATFTAGNNPTGNAGGFQFNVGATNAIGGGGTTAMKMLPTGNVQILQEANISSIVSNKISTTTVNASVVSTTILNTPLINVSTLFTNTLNFNPTISPTVDLGLGGVIGGLIGGASGNVFNTALGAGALGTGIAGLTMPRTTGGVAPGTFQTYAGTSQIQFSTLGADTPSAFLTTTAGIGAFGSTITTTLPTIPAGAWAFRTVSDPMNIATNDQKGAVSTIQAASQWNSVFPGNAQVNSVGLASLTSGNTIDLGNNNSADLKINAQTGHTVVIGGTGNLTANGVINANSERVSTLTVYTSATIPVINEVSTINFTSGVTQGVLAGVSSINNVAYPPPTNIPYPPTTLPYTATVSVRAQVGTYLASQMSGTNQNILGGSPLTCVSGGTFFPMNDVFNAFQLIWVQISGYAWNNGGNAGQQQVYYWISPSDGSGDSSELVVNQFGSSYSTTPNGNYLAFRQGYSYTSTTPVCGGLLIHKSQVRSVNYSSASPAYSGYAIFPWVYINTSGGTTNITTDLSIRWRGIF